MFKGMLVRQPRRKATATNGPVCRGQQVTTDVAVQFIDHIRELARRVWWLSLSARTVSMDGI